MNEQRGAFNGNDKCSVIYILNVNFSSQLKGDS